MKITRRGLLASSASLGTISIGACTSLPKENKEFSASWESLSEYQRPSWFKNAKFGIWAHWGPQCQPEQGDWYGRQMYMEGNHYYNYHKKHYGHPSEFGFMEIMNLWKADKWQPEELMKLFKNAGAKYFVSMANHHDNLDMYNSKYHAWNTLNIGPKQDIVGTWEKLSRKYGLRFGVSNHAAHAWHWWQTAYNYDTLGDKKGVRYDAARLTKEQGKGKWWDGLDPQELYCGPYKDMVAPDGFTSPQEMQKFNDERSGEWTEKAPINNPFFTKQWLLRQNDLVDKYKPDFVYFDNYGLPLEEAGLEATAYFYNQNKKWNGTNQAIVTGKKLNVMQQKAITDDVEKGFINEIRAEAWQTCSCIGNWHYDRPLYENNGYKSAKNVVQRLIDVVSKNGNLLLSIPMRGDGTIDEKELQILQDLAAWMKINQEAIFDTKPLHIFGEGPTKFAEGMQNENQGKTFDPKDIRFTQKGNYIYIMPLEWAMDNEILITSFATDEKLKNTNINSVELLGIGKIDFKKTNEGLVLKYPNSKTSFTPVFKIS